MAEPAPIYDPDDDQPVTRPDLRAIEGGGETTSPRRGHIGIAGEEKAKSPEELREAESGGSFYKPDGAESAEQGKLAGVENQIPGGFNPNDKSRLGRMSAYFTGLSKNKKLLMGGGGALGIVTIFISIFLALLPLKINHIVENLQSKFFASSEQAVERRTDHLLSVYIKKHVLPSFSNCKGVASSRTINKECMNPIDGETPAAKLFRGWRDARLENKLADNYGIEFERRGGGSGGYLLRMQGLPEIVIGKEFATDNRGLDDLF